jgi:hypothetical protein
MLDVPSLDGLGWSKVRTLARELAAEAPPKCVMPTARQLLDAPDPPHRMFARRPV